MTVKEMPVCEQPREKAKLYGIRSLSSAELLSVLLRTGRKGTNAIETADELLRKAGGVGRLASMSMKELTQIKGIGEVKALQITAAFELNRRIALEETRHRDLVTEPEVLVEWLKKEIGLSMQEEFLVVYLDVQHRIISYEVLFKGTLNMSCIYPREVFKQALLSNCTSLVLVHNHPDGEVTPSSDDLTATAEIIRLGTYFDIEVMDHLIVSRKQYLSFRQEGILPMAQKPVK
jgi:DNA repair protein RadC